MSIKYPVTCRLDEKKMYEYNVIIIKGVLRVSKIEIGVQLYTFRRLCKTPAGVKEVMEKVAALGATNVQLSSICEMSAKSLREIADGCGLIINGTHSPFARIVNDIDALAEEHLTMGCEIVGLGMMPQKFTRGEDSLKRFCEITNTACEKLKPYGLKFGYHNHWMEFKEIGGVPKLDIMAREVPEMQFIFDTFWARFAGHDPLAYVEKFANRLDLLHLKDYSKFGFMTGKVRDIGKGTIDFAPILRAAEKGGTKWAVIEHDSTKRPYVTVEDSINFIKTIY